MATILRAALQAYPRCVVNLFASAVAFTSDF